MYALISDYNLSAGVQVMACYANDITGGVFMKALYITLWCILVFGAYRFQKVSTGMGDLPACIAFGSFVALIFSIFMRLIDCTGMPLTDNISLAVLIVMALLGFIFLMNNHNDNV